MRSYKHPNCAFDALCAAISDYMSPLTARAVVRTALRQTGRSERRLTTRDVDDTLRRRIEEGLHLYKLPPAKLLKVHVQLKAISCGRRTASGSIQRIEPTTTTSVKVETERDIVRARGVARTYAKEVGFGNTDQIKVATAVSEITRNIYKYAGGGIVTLVAQRIPKAGVLVTAVDEGPGIPHIEEVLGGEYKSKTGMGLGIWGCKRLMDEFDIDSEEGRGTTVKMAKYV